MGDEKTVEAGIVVEIGAKRPSDDASTIPLLKTLFEVVLDVSQGLPRGWAWRDIVTTVSTWSEAFLPWATL
jgi:hypothetical protein